MSKPTGFSTIMGWVLQVTGNLNMGMGWTWVNLCNLL